MRSLHSAALVMFSLLVWPALALAAPVISGYGPYELHRTYALDELPSGLTAGADASYDGYSVKTVLGQDTVTFGNQTNTADVTLFLHQNQLVCVKLSIEQPDSADRHEMRRFTGDLYDKLKTRYRGAKMYVDKYADHDWLAAGEAILLMSDEYGKSDAAKANFICLLRSGHTIELYYATADGADYIVEDRLTSEQKSWDKL